jgi:hypothetical protein
MNFTAMAPDEIMVYTGMFIVPIVGVVASVLLLRAAHRRALSAWVSFVLFVAAVAGGMVLSFGYVWLRGSLLSGDGALAVIAAPVTGAILTAPVALAFLIGLVVIRSNQRQSHPE